MEDAGLSLFQPVKPLSTSEFIDYMLHSIIEDYDIKAPRFCDTLSKTNERGLFLTHGDLHTSNMIVDKKGRNGSYVITGLIDWTTAGWYPIYWEGFKARPYNPSSFWWREFIPQFAGIFPEEYDILRELNSKSMR